jgi:DNA-directed RNA polymerase subunit alpha
MINQDFIDHLRQTDFSARKIDMAQRYLDGETLKQIAEHWGLSRTRIDQIIRQLERGSRSPKYCGKSWSECDAIINKEKLDTRWVEIHKLEAEIRQLQAKVDVLRNEINTQPLEELDLNVRAFNALKRAGIDTVYELKTYINGVPSRLLNIRNLGLNSITEIMDKVGEYEACL